jgi:hypothetical protein
MKADRFFNQYVPVVAFMVAVGFFFGMWFGINFKVNNCVSTRVVYKAAPLPLHVGINVCKQHFVQLDAITWVYNTGFDSTAWLFQCKDAGIYDLAGDRVWPQS